MTENNRQRLVNYLKRRTTPKVYRIDIMLLDLHNAGILEVGDVNLISNLIKDRVDEYFKAIEG